MKKILTTIIVLFALILNAQSLQDLKNTVAFSEPMKTSIIGIIDVTYQMALQEGKTEGEALIIAAHKLGNILDKMNPQIASKKETVFGDTIWYYYSPTQEERLNNITGENIKRIAPNGKKYSCYSDKKDEYCGQKNYDDIVLVCMTVNSKVVEFESDIKLPLNLGINTRYSLFSNSIYDTIEVEGLAIYLSDEDFENGVDFKLVPTIKTVRICSQCWDNKYFLTNGFEIPLSQTTIKAKKLVNIYTVKCLGCSSENSKKWQEIDLTKYKELIFIKKPK